MRDNVQRQGEHFTHGATTIREQLEKHKRNANFATCHVKMDPYGFALKSFDVIGLSGGLGCKHSPNVAQHVDEFALVKSLYSESNDRIPALLPSSQLISAASHWRIGESTLEKSSQIPSAEFIKKDNACYSARRIAAPAVRAVRR